MTTTTYKPGLALLALVAVLALTFTITSAQAQSGPSLATVQKQAAKAIGSSLAAAVKDNACHWQAGPAYRPIGPGDSPAAAYSRCMIHGSHMSRDFRRCLIAGGITAAGVAVGGWIGGAAARVIAGGIVGGGGSACLSQLAL
ncbi:MAG: hypothetical protein V7607_1221 [Solirubrobacteraceae bacterium]